jgi:hypothetical protein
MEQLHRKERNRLNLRIKTIKTYIERNNTSIIALKSQTVSDYIVKKIKSLKNDNIKYLEEIDSLNKRQYDLSNGYLDDELKNKCNQNKKEIDLKNTRKENIIKEKKERKQEDKNKSDQYFQTSKQERRNFFSKQRLIGNFEKKYFSILETVPDYIIKNLKTMPNNKGYIWRNVRFYGCLPAESNKDILFQKIDGELYIHEITNSVHKIYKKVNKKNVTVWEQKRDSKYKQSYYI